MWGGHGDRGEDRRSTTSIHLQLGMLWDRGDVGFPIKEAPDPANSYHGSQDH